MNDLTAFAISILILLGLAHVVTTYTRLRHVPGPFAASFNDVWRLWAMNVPGYGERLVGLHRKYGPLIRLGPDRVSTSDASMIHVVFGTNPTWEKVSNSNSIFLEAYES